MIVIAGMRPLNILFVIYLLTCLLLGCNTPPPDNVAISFYNCELLYDTIDNPLTDDDDFTPNRKNKYGARLYGQKLHNMAVVLQSMKEAPVLVGVAEVENERVLHDLTQQPELQNRKYKYLLHQGEDRRGMNVGLLYSGNRFKVIGSSITAVPLGDTEKTRGILTVQGVLDGDTLYVVVNHWPSRRGGVEETAGKREMAATILRTITETIQSRHEEAQILLMGDFNDNPNDANIAQFLGAYDDPERVQDQGFYNPFAELYAAGEGTEVYQHQWNLFDQIIVSGTLLRDGRLRYTGAEIYKPAFLQSKHKDHKGEPYRSWLGSKWINGYSDHFPVVVRLVKSR
jgi:endonuclease/exonuclease/phosphatase family metal-dependent hydrolase